MRKIIKKNDLNEATTKPWAGAMFLGITLAAILGLVALIYIEPQNPPEKTENISKQDSSESHIERAKKQIETKLPTQRKNMAFPSHEAIKGIWTTHFGQNSVAQIALAGNLFELILVKDTKSYRHEYSKGTYEYNEKTGKLSLYPSADFSAPQPKENIQYKILTMRAFDMYLQTRSKDRSLYFIAPEKDVITKAIHPLFLHADFTGAPVLRFDRPE